MVWAVFSASGATVVSAAPGTPVEPSDSNQPRAGSKSFKSAESAPEPISGATDVQDTDSAGGQKS